MSLAERTEPGESALRLCYEHGATLEIFVARGEEGHVLRLSYGREMLAIELPAEQSEWIGRFLLGGGSAPAPAPTNGAAASAVADRIVQAVGATTGFSGEDLLGPSRKHYLSAARAIAMYVLCHQQQMSQSRVARMFHRHPSAAHQACRRTSAWISRRSFPKCGGGGKKLAAALAAASAAWAAATCATAANGNP